MDLTTQADGSTPNATPLNSNGATNGVNTVPGQQPIYFNVTTPTPAASDERTEQRINALMSQKDKANADLAKTQQDLTSLQTELAKYKETVQGATETTRQLLEQKATLEREREQYRAETLKLQKLAQSPELLPYQQFIPATTDENALQTAIDQFKQLREHDLARVTKPLDPAQGPRALYPNANIPPAQPASVAPGGAPLEQAMKSFEEKVRAAANLADPAQRDLEMAKLRQEASGLAREQFRMS